MGYAWRCFRVNLLVKKKLIENKLSLRQGNLVLTGTPLSLHTVKIGDDIRNMVDDYEFVNCKII